MPNVAAKSSYARIADELCDMIRNRAFVEGTQLFSRQELCERYGISDKTAFRVHAELQSRGVVVSISGKGLFVHRIADLEMQDNDQILQPLRRIYIHGVKAKSKLLNLFIKPIYEGIVDTAEKLGIAIDHKDSGTAASEIRANALQFTPEPTDASIFLGGSLDVQVAYGRFLSDISYRTCLIDTAMIGSVCVLSDNCHGMQSLFEHAVGQGCERLIYAGRFGHQQNMINESERSETFSRLAAERELDAAVILSGSYEEVNEEVGRSRVKTAVMFSQDDPALVFKRQLPERKLSVPVLVTGFDDVAMRERGVESLTTYRVNLRRMGEVAVAALAAYAPSWRTELFHRVRGELMVRE